MSRSLQPPHTSAHALIGVLFLLSNGRIDSLTPMIRELGVKIVSRRHALLVPHIYHGLALHTDDLEHSWSEAIGMYCTSRWSAPCMPRVLRSCCKCICMCTFVLQTYGGEDQDRSCFEWPQSPRLFTRPDLVLSLRYTQERCQCMLRTGRQSHHHSCACLETGCQCQG